MSVESHDLGSVADLTALSGYGDSYVVPGDEVYVVSEDCDYIYRNPGTNPVADGFNIIDAIFLPGYWERRSGSSGSAGLRFNTIAIGASGSGRLIDVGLSGLVDGVSTAWVESVKDTWRWDATSTLTADNITVCNPTANGVNPGRFIRKLEPAPEWLLQTTWFVDSTAANEEGDGSALTPVKTDVEIGRRWGVSARLTVPILVTYVNAPSTITNYDVNIFPDAALTLKGTPTTSKSGILITAVQAQIRTAGAEVRHAITGATLGAADVGKLAIIRSGTLANIGAYAKILRDDGAGKVVVSPFGIATPGEFPGFTQVIPVANVDVIDVIEPTELLVGALRFHNFTRTNPFTSPATNSVVLDSLTLNGGLATFGAGEIVSDGLIVQYARSNLKDISINGESPVSYVGHSLLGGGVEGWLQVNCNGLFFQQSGVLNAAVDVNPGGLLVLGTDAYMQSVFTSIFFGGNMSSAGSAFFDCATSDLNLSISFGGHYEQFGPIPDWGTNNTGHGIRVTSTCNYVYQVKPTINETLGAGREALIGGTDKLYAAIPFIEPANNAAMVLRA